jgi:hypothetical protein
MQKEWIGMSEGADLFFQIDGEHAGAAGAFSD